MKIKFLKDVKTPSKGKVGDAGWDLYLPEDIIIQPHSTQQVKLGIAIELFGEEVGIISERSGSAIKYGLHTIGNIIDSNYRGEISMIVQNNSNISREFKKGERVAQLLIVKLGSQELTVVDELSSSERGENAHYSSGK